MYIYRVELDRQSPREFFPLTHRVWLIGELYYYCIIFNFLRAKLYNPPDFQPAKRDESPLVRSWTGHNINNDNQIHRNDERRWSHGIGSWDSYHRVGTSTRHRQTWLLYNEE